MRQNPGSRIGRQMPAWFNAPSNSQFGDNMTPPLPPEPAGTDEESEYEEIDHFQDGVKRFGRGGRAICSLCGTGAAVVHCGSCESQLFCGECNDMYHRHPKRSHHIRKLLDPGENRPPLPPKSFPTQPQNQNQGFPSSPQGLSSLPPIAPPRRSKPPRSFLPFGMGMRTAASSPTLVKKTFDPMGTLKRFVGNMAQRPLPPPPKQGPPPLPPKPLDLSRPSTPVMMGRGPSPSPSLQMQMYPSERRFQNQMQNRNSQFRQQSMSIANLSMQRASTPTGGEWEESFQVQDPWARQRAQSICTPNRFGDPSHFATMGRGRKVVGSKAPERPPPLPQRSMAYPQASQSAFNINQMGQNQWGYPGYPADFQQQQPQFMGYPPGTMRRTPSNQSVGAFPQQQFMGWGPMGFGPPMSQEEMVWRGSGQLWNGVPRPMSVTQSSPVTPQGSFRRKSRPQGWAERGRQASDEDDIAKERFIVKPPPQQSERVVVKPQAQLPARPRAPPIPKFKDKDLQDVVDTEKDPNGPWTCGHCTFINPKSAKICTICCKTNPDGLPESRKNSSASSATDEIPVVQSTLSISRGESQQSTINLTESVVKSPSKKSSPIAQRNVKDFEEDLEEEQVVVHKIKINSNKSLKVDSNEDVYGSVPLSPKIEIRRQSNTKSQQKPKVNQEPIENKSNKEKSNKIFEAKAQQKAKNTNNSSSSTSSSGNSNKPIKKEAPKKTFASSSVQANVTSNDDFDGSSSSSSNSSIISSNSVPSNALQIQQNKGTKSSKGTSPPPQSISTQTYGEMPAQKSQSHSKTSSTQSLLSENDYAPPKNMEMSEKALRYLRKAQNLQNSRAKLKRSRSTNLSSASEPWVEVESHEERPFYRSSSRHSLINDTRSLPYSGPSSRESSPPRRFYDFRDFQPPALGSDRLPSAEDYFASLEDLVMKNTARRDSVRVQETELGRLLKEAEESNYTPEEVQVALRMCGERNPVKWLQENWEGMVETVQTLASKYGREKGENNQTGTISSTEAKNALRSHRGNVWSAVTDCIAQRKKKFLELQSRGNFLPEDILTSLTANHGNLDAAYVELSKAQLKPFLMRIWGPPSGLENDSAPPPPTPNKSVDVTVAKEKVLGPEPRLELLVSNAAKVSEEIGKVIEELKQSKLEAKRAESILCIPQNGGGKSDEEESFLSASNSELNISLEEIEDDILETANEQPQAEVPESVNDETIEPETAHLASLMTSDDPKTQDIKANAELEQLISTLTSTFSNMGQLATEFKSTIANEIQQQLAAVIQISGPPPNESESNIDPVENAYEPVTLSESVSATVAKKMEKYRKLAAKKGSEGKNRHKSPVAGQSSPSPLPPSEDDNLGENIEIVLNSLEAEVETKNETEQSTSSETDSSSSESEPISSENGQIEQEQSQSHSSRSDSEQEMIIDEDYEEIELSHTSDFEAYNNKDTDKEPLMVQKIAKLEVIPISQEIEVPIELELETTPKSENEIRMQGLLASGKIETSQKALLALQLLDMNFSEEDSIAAASECSSLESCLSFLQQECDLCAGKFSARQMVSLLRCTHVCCHNCAKEYFTVQIRDKSIVDANCPFCGEPGNLADEGASSASDYFNHLDILLKSILEPKIHEMFQRKLRDWALAQTPNFKWCSKCSSGFITEPLQTRLICPDCNAVTCAICLEQWDKFNHDHKGSKVKVCDGSSKTIVDYLNENCVECPRCHFRFALARGGCMHLTCTQCRHEFCSGCSASFKLGARCDAKLPICDKLGLHAHHPRNCLFYLRDKEPEILSKLLEENAINYLKENSETTNDDGKRCKVPIQKETSEGLKDGFCDRELEQGFSSVCKSHYVEYLGLLIWQNQLDPISILSSDDLEVIIRRANKKHPGRPFNINEVDFRNRLLQVIEAEIPL